MRTRRTLGAASWLGVVITILTPGCADACRAPDGLCVNSAALMAAVNNYPDSQMPPIEAWDTSAATDMSRLFSKRDFNGNISGWHTASVTSMASMFAGATAFDGVSCRLGTPRA